MKTRAASAFEARKPLEIVEVVPSISPHEPKGLKATMDYRQLRYFLAAAETLNFGMAAQQLHVSQASVSRRIADLEYDLKQALFRRSPRPLVLSPAGERLLVAARRIVGDMDAVRDEFRRMGPNMGRSCISISRPSV